MTQDVAKQLDRARRSLEKNKLREAVSEYQAILEQSPTNQEALQALADIYTRLNEPALAAPYYAAQFDRLVEIGDGAKASAVFTRFLRPFPQPADRLMRFAALLQKQNRASESIEHYGAASEIFQQQHRDVEALACCESIALLDPENPARHVVLGELAERLHHVDLAARSFVRAGQLTLAAGPLEESLDYFGRAHRLLPQDRTAALLFANAKMRNGDAEGAVSLLDPFSPNEKDIAFLALFGEALFRTGRLDRARETFEAYYEQKPEGFTKLFDLAGAFIEAGQDDNAASLLEQTKETMRKARRERELTTQIDRLAAGHTSSLPLAQFVARLYEELNRETRYFEALVQLFDLYLIAGRVQEACDVLDRLVDIDPYDYRNHERIASLQGKVDPNFLSNIVARAAKASTVSTRPTAFVRAGSDAGPTVGDPAAGGQSEQALEDLIVQAEIFLQYSLQAKAVERLQRLAELYPDEEERNDRLRALYERANWWPKGAPPPPTQKQTASPASAASPVPLPNPVAAPADTHRDLATIAEINRAMYRQPTPREVLAATAAGIGRHLGATRCLVAVGSPGDAALATAEYFEPGMGPAGTARISSIAAMVGSLPPDSLGGIELDVAKHPVLQEMELSSGLAVILTDKETQMPAGALLVGDASPRKWKPNESFFLQAVGDQLLLSVTHTRLRSLVRSLSVADEKTGVLSRVAYVDCLMMEANRAQKQGTPLSLVFLQVDRGADLLHAHEDSQFEQYVDQLAQTLRSTIRQTDVVVKYSAWSLAFILPDTSLENGQALADKLRQTAAEVKPSWGADGMSFSAVVAQASSHPHDETEDRVTEWMNRAEAGLDELSVNSGNAVLALATP